MSIDTEVGIVSPMRSILALELDSKNNSVYNCEANIGCGLV